MASYIVKEEDGTSKLVLEEGGGFLLLEESTPEEAIQLTIIYHPIGTMT